MHIKVGKNLIKLLSNILYDLPDIWENEINK